MSDQAQTIEFTVRLEIQDWFKKRFNETYGPHVQLQYLSNDEHFEVYTRAELTASKDTIGDVIKFIENTSDLLQYKLPWLSDNVYYNDGTSYQDIIKEKLSTQAKNTNYTTTGYTIIGCGLLLFNFAPNLNDTEKLKIDEIFKTLPHSTSLFLTYPKVRTARRQSSFHFATNILMGYHGSYLQYLNLEDIISLEIANNSQEAGADAHLDHDFQKFLRSKCPELYEDADIWNLKDFKINEVLRYFIHKYHNHVKTIYISNILTTDEIQSLSQSYNIEIVCNNLIHIDFKSENDHKPIDFCVIYHYDPRSLLFLNYNSQYVSENHTTKFNADDSLEPLTCGADFSYMVIKTQNNCPPAKTNSVLKCVTDHFIALDKLSILILNEFDLNHVSQPILGSLVKMMAKGVLEFYKMNFNLETFSGILEQSTNNYIIFNKCHIRVCKLNRFRINSQRSRIEFLDMDIDQNLLYSLNNLEDLEVMNCRILATNVLIEMEICSYIACRYTSLSVTALVQLLNGLHSAQILIFESCKLTTNDLVETNFVELTNETQFNNMTFQTNTFLRIFEKFKFRDGLVFENCQFLHDDNESYINQLELVNLKFFNIQFDPPTLLTILEFLNNDSEVWLTNCCITCLDDNHLTTKIIKADYVHFEKCKLEANSLLQIFSQMSKTTFVVVDCCDVVHSSSSDLINLSTVPQIHFRNMNIESRLARSILQTNSKIIFDNCCLQFMAVEFINVPIHASILFLNMRFLSPAQLDWFGSFTLITTIKFFNCHFEFTNLEISNILIQSQWIYFWETSFKLEVLLQILRRVSEYTIVFIDACEIRDIDPKLHIPPIRIRDVYLWNMSLQLKTILCMFKDFRNLEDIKFKNCKILCADPNELPDITLKPSTVRFFDMNIDVHGFRTIVQKCAKRLFVLINNCKIVSSSKSSKVLLDINTLIFKNVNYSQDLLQLLQSLKPNCIVTFSDQLSKEAIIEICTKSAVHGERLALDDHTVTATFYFELFAEYYRDKALNFELDTNTEYDLPIDIIPRIGGETYKKYKLTNSQFNEYDWDEFKIKCVEVNDATMKLEFLRNGEVIDLWFLLNDLPDDSSECLVNYC